MTSTLPCPQMPTFDDLLNTVLDRLPRARSEYTALLDALSQRDRHLLVLTSLNSQVCNGGFGQWVENRYAAQDGATLLLALERMQQRSAAPLARHVEKVLDLTRLCLRHVANAEDPEQLADHELEYLDRLDDGYYVLSDEFWPLTETYFLTWAD